MKKLKQLIKKHGVKLLVVAAVGLVLLLVGIMYRRIALLSSQLKYLQDTTDIILSDMGGLESGIAQTLQDETSLVEDFQITVKGMDFRTETYDVDVRVIPKEYTDKTKVSVFFGTNECVLKGDGYVYTGTATLPLDEDYDGNLTFLFANGKKKNTDVYSNYTGIKTKLDDVLWGELTGAPKYKDGKLTMKDSVSYQLDGADLYKFSFFELVASYNSHEIYSKDLRYAESEENQKSSFNWGLRQEESTESAAEPVQSEDITSTEGRAEFELEYEPALSGKLRLYLRAVTNEGYRFEYDLLSAAVTEEQKDVSSDDGSERTAGEETASNEEDAETKAAEPEEPKLLLDNESISYPKRYRAFDNRGGVRELPIKQEETRTNE